MIFQNGRKMSHSHIWHFSETGGKCLIVIYDNFYKQKENVPWSYVTLFQNGRKMSHSHMWHFLETGGKCPIVICDTFQKWKENVPWSYVTIFRNGRKMSQSYVTLFINGRKMSTSDVWHFSEMGGKCPIVICDAFQKREEIVPVICDTF